MYKLCFFVPPSHLEDVKNALFAKGAGKIGLYEACCWQTLGTGQFKPMSGSQPFIGESDQLEQLDEWKVEMVCDDTLIRSIVDELKRVHPYEEVAYDVWQLAEF